MNCHSESSIFSFPRNSCAHDIYEIESTAAKALKKIQLIYDEIMTPEQYNSDDPEIVNNILDESFENPTNSVGQQKHYLKTCCSTLKELCVKCDRAIIQCGSCNQCNCNKSKNTKTLENFQNSGNVQHTKYRPRSAQKNEYKVKCTVPKPFSLSAKNEERQKAKEYKISKFKEEREKEIENELKIRANCKPVPKNTHLPLYNKLVEEQENHKVKRKEKGFEILNSTKPFNLQTSKNTLKARSSSNLTSENISNFIAKPAPKHILSNKMSEKLKNKEEVRKMLMIERANRTKEQSSSPFSKPITFSRSLINLFNLNKTDNKEDSKPKNISEITKRLYIKKCNETMDSWNKKVLLVDSHKKMTNQENQNLLLNESVHKKQLTKKKELPFMYFPVRMTNATILREKQIRAEMSARKEREKRTKNEELAKGKTNADILYKLRDLIPSSDGEKEIDEKVKTFRESQIRRKLEYEKELEEIMKRVAEQTLLLERQTKIKQTTPRSFSEKESEADANGNESTIPDSYEATPTESRSSTI